MNPMLSYDDMICHINTLTRLSNSKHESIINHYDMLESWSKLEAYGNVITSIKEDTVIDELMTKWINTARTEFPKIIYEVVMHYSKLDPDTIDMDFTEIDTTLDLIGDIVKELFGNNINFYNYTPPTIPSFPIDQHDQKVYYMLTGHLKWGIDTLKKMKANSESITLDTLRRSLMTRVLVNPKSH